MNNTTEALKELLAEQKWAANWTHNIVPSGAPAHKLACEAIRALPYLFAEIERLTTPVIDLDKSSWNSLCEAASQSAWIPQDYYMNDWVSDCADFLRNGPLTTHGREAELTELLRCTLAYLPSTLGITQRVRAALSQEDGE